MTLFLSDQSARATAHALIHASRQWRKFKILPKTRRDYDTRHVEQGFAVKLFGRTGEVAYL